MTVCFITKSLRTCTRNKLVREQKKKLKLPQSIPDSKSSLGLINQNEIEDRGK